MRFKAALLGLMLVVSGCRRSAVPRPGVLDFGEVWVGVGSPPMMAVWHNDAPAGVSMEVRSVDLNEPFRYFGQPGGFAPAWVAPRTNSPYVDIFFRPLSAGDFHGELVPRGSFSASPLELRGRGIVRLEAGALSLAGDAVAPDSSPRPIDFGSVPVGSYSSRMLVVHNSSASDIKTTLVYQSGRYGLKLDRTQAYFKVHAGGHLLSKVDVPAHGETRVIISYVPELPGENWEAVYFMDGDLQFLPWPNSSLRYTPGAKHSTNLAATVLHGIAVDE